VSAREGQTRAAPGPACECGPVRGCRAAAREHGAVAALSRLHADTSPGVLPVGAGGHVLVPADVAAVCDDYETPDGPRSRAGVDQHRLAQIPVAGRELTALRICGAGPAGGPGSVNGWQIGLGWYRLGLADRLLSQAVTYLRGRSAAGTALIDLPLVRAALADAASGTAEAHSLLDYGVTAASLRQAHRTLNEVGRGCLQLFGATGFLLDGPGSEVRASELLADTYAPPDELEWP
jgi:hypothetical protein